MSDIPRRGKPHGKFVSRRGKMLRNQKMQPHIRHTRNNPASANRARQDAVITLQALIFYPVWNGACDWIMAHRTSSEQLFFQLSESQWGLLICRNGSLNEQKIKNNTFGLLAQLFLLPRLIHYLGIWFAPSKVMFVFMQKKKNQLISCTRCVLAFLLLALLF